MIGGDKAIMGQLPENQSARIRPSDAMIKVGTWGKDARQIHNFYPVSEFSHIQAPFGIRIGDATLSEVHMKGHCKVTQEDAVNTENING